MAIPTNREQFVAYCLRALGAPVITINVAPEQVDDRVDEALKLFYERHYNAVEEVYILFDITGRERANKFILLDPDIVGVTDVFRPNGNGNVFDIQFQTQFQLNDMYANSIVGGYTDMTYYYINHSYMSLLNRFFSPDRQFSFNPITHRLMIAGGVKDTDNMEGGVIIKAYKKVYGETPADADDNTNNIVSNIWQDRWLTAFTTAIIKKQWAQNMYKFKDLPMLGGVVMNGAELMAQAEAEIKELREELDNTYSFPPGFLVG